MPEGAARSRKADLDSRREIQNAALLELVRLLGRSAARDGLLISAPGTRAPNSDAKVNTIGQPQAPRRDDE